MGSQNYALQEQIFNQSGVVVINTNVAYMDCSSLKGIAVNITSVGVTGIITVEWSNDEVNWKPGALVPATPSGLPVATTNVAGLWTTQIYGRYFRLRMSTATTSGTTTVATTGFKDQYLGGENAAAVNTQAVNGTVTITLPAPTTFIQNSAASTNLTSVRPSACNLYGVTVSNNGASVAFLKLYNKASAPVLASDIPVLIISIPANGVPVPINLGTLGVRFSTGLAFAITNLIADTDATAVAAGQVKTTMTYV